MVAASAVLQARISIVSQSFLQLVASLIRWAYPSVDSWRYELRGGLVSSFADCSRFFQMIVNNGEVRMRRCAQSVARRVSIIFPCCFHAQLDGVRLLKAAVRSPGPVQHRVVPVSSRWYSKAEGFVDASSQDRAAARA